MLVELHNDSFFEILQHRYGRHFEKMSKREKLFLIQLIASQISVTCSEKVRPEIHHMASKIMQHLTPKSQQDLIVLLANPTERE
jgi:hypothetical protein